MQPPRITPLSFYRFNKSRQFAGTIRSAVFAVPTHLLEQFIGASLHILQTNRAPGLLTSRALSKIIASAAKACQSNTLQGIGQSADLLSGSGFPVQTRGQVSGFDRKARLSRNLEPETVNQRLYTNRVCGFKLKVACVILRLSYGRKTKTNRRYLPQLRFGR